jgi:hypothetical protein
MAQDQKPPEKSTPQSSYDKSNKPEIDRSRQFVLLHIAGGVFAPNNGMHPTPLHGFSHGSCAGARVMPVVRPQ